MKNHAVTRMVIGLASIAVLVSACSSSGSSPAESSHSAGQSGSKGSGSGPQGTPIVIGNIGSYSGAQGSTIGSGKDGIEAWAAALNASGGIHGHPVKLIVKDDAQNPTTALSQVRELIEKDHVVAIVSDQSSADTQWAPLVSKAGVPVVGGFGINLTLATNPNFFASGTNLFALTYGTQVNAKAAGPKFAALYCAEAPQCQILVKLEKALSKVTGEQVPLVAPVSATAPDYTALCQSIKNARVQSYSIGTGVAVVARVAKACAQQGVTAKQQVIGALDKSWLKEPAFDGTVAVNSVFPSFDRSTPATQAFQAAMTKYGHGNNASNAAEAWVAGKLFEAAAKAVPAGKAITSASIKTGLYSLKNETLGGIAPPLTYLPGKPLLVNCWYTTGISNGKLTEPKGLRTVCAPDALIASIVKASTAG